MTNSAAPRVPVVTMSVAPADDTWSWELRNGPGTIEEAGWATSSEAAWDAVRSAADYYRRTRIETPHGGGELKDAIGG